MAWGLTKVGRSEYSITDDNVLEDEEVAVIHTDDIDIARLFRASLEMLCALKEISETWESTPPVMRPNEIQKAEHLIDKLEGYGSRDLSMYAYEKR